MRNRIALVTIGGQQRRIFRFESFPGRYVSAVCITSETPQHAEMTIRKINSYKWNVLHDRMRPKTPKARKKLFLVLSSTTQYRAAIGL